MVNLPKSFWGEAVVTACYLINRSPSVEGVPDLTPTSSSLDNATNREEVQDENYGDEPTEFDADELAGVDDDDVTNTDGVE